MDGYETLALLLILFLMPLFGIAAAQAFRRWFAPGPRYCPQCGHVGAARKQMRGSLAVELLLYFFFIVPGLVYSLWRASTKAPTCELCGQPGVIPADSPRARAVLG